MKLIVIYLLIVVTGLLIINVGIGANKTIEQIFGYMFVTFGVIDILILLMKKKK